VIPETTNSALLLLIEAMVTLVPDAVSVPPLLELEPTVTLPKLTLVGDTLSCPEAVAVPLSGIDTIVFPLELIAENEPVKLPAAAGENETLNV